jgi:hypothetical protein
VKRIFKAVPEAVESPSKDVAAALGLPWHGPGMPKLVIGRREWIALPDLGVSPLNAKTDSGARSSSIHAENVSLATDEKSVTFTTTNHGGDVIPCHAAVARTGLVRSSSGTSRKRIFIETTAMLAGGFRWQIQISLADRSEMLCPMLLGRSALAGYFLVEPQGAHLLGTRQQLERQR